MWRTYLANSWLLLVLEPMVSSFHTQYSSSSGYSQVKVGNDRDGYSYETKVFHGGSPLGFDSTDHGFYSRSLASLGEEAYNRYAPLFYSSLDYHILNLDLDLDIDLLELELDSNLDLDLDYYLSLYGLNYLGKSRHFWKAGKHIPLMLGHLYGLGISHLGSFGLGYGLGYSLGYGYDKYGITDEIEDHLEDHSDSHVGFGLNLDHHFNFGHDFHHSDLSDDEDDDHVVSESSFGWFKR